MLPSLHGREARGGGAGRRVLLPSEVEGHGVVATLMVFTQFKTLFAILVDKLFYCHWHTRLTLYYREVFRFNVVKVLLSSFLA